MPISMDDQCVARTSKMSAWIHREPGRSGKTHERIYLEHPGAVVILPFLRDGRLVLIENRRIVVGRTVLEVPAGTLSPGEDSWAAAPESSRRKPVMWGEWVKLGTYLAAPAFCDEVMHVFAVRNGELGRARPDDVEEITPLALSEEELGRFLREGRFEDGKTLLALSYWRSRVPAAFESRC